VAVTLDAPPGWTAGSPVTIRRVPAGGTATATLTMTAPAPLPPDPVLLTAVARYDSGHDQQVLLGSTLVVTSYRPLAAAFDNAGVSADTDTGAANLDGLGFSLSATALASAGVTPGSTVTAGGLSFTWPSAPPGRADNVVSAGQPIAVGRAGHQLGFLDTATFGPVQGSGTIVYASGQTQGFTLTVPDWYSGPAAGAAIAMAYRNAPGNLRDNHPVQVYEQSVPLDSAAPVTGVILPGVSGSASGGALHIFGLTVG
jgi:hypothetical protein